MPHCMTPILNFLLRLDLFGRIASPSRDSNSSLQDHNQAMTDLTDTCDHLATLPRALRQSRVKLVGYFFGRPEQDPETEIKNLKRQARPFIDSEDPLKIFSP